MSWCTEHRGSYGGPPTGPPGAEEGDGEWVVRLRGLPFSALEEEIANWFAPMPARRVHIVLTGSGRPSGDAFAEFDNEAQWEHAMSKNRQHMGSRYVEIFGSSRHELMSSLSHGEPPSRYHHQHHGPPSYNDHQRPPPHMPHHYPGPDPGHMAGPGRMPGYPPQYAGGYSNTPSYNEPSGYNPGGYNPSGYNPGGYNPMAHGNMPPMGTGMGGPLGAPGVDPTIALLQLTTALSQQAAQAQARSHGAPTVQSQLAMMMQQAAASGWNTASTAPTAPAYPVHSAPPIPAPYDGAAPAPVPSGHYAAPAASGVPPGASGDASKGVTIQIRGTLAAQ